MDSLDWKDLTAGEINKRVLSKVKNGAIILLHNGAKNTPEALKNLLPAKEKDLNLLRYQSLYAMKTSVLIIQLVLSAGREKFNTYGLCGF